MNDTVISSAPAATQTATRTTNATPDVRPTNPQASVAADGFKASLQKSLSASLAEAFPPANRPADVNGSGSEPSPESNTAAPESATSPAPADDAPNVATPAGETAETLPDAPESSDAANLTKALKAERAEKKRIRQELAQLKAQLKNGPTPETDTPETPERAAAGETAKRSPQEEVKHLTNVVGRIKGWLRTAQADPERVVAELKALNMPVTHESVNDWLATQLDTYGDQLMDAKVEERFAREVNGYQERNTRQTAEQAAAQWVPELENPDSPEAQRFAELQSKHPGLADDPLATALLAAAVLGFKAIEGKGKAAPATPAKPAANGAAMILPKRNGTPRPTVDGNAPVNGDVAVSAPTLLARYATSGSDGDKNAFKRVYGLGLLGRMVRK